MFVHYRKNFLTFSGNPSIDSEKEEGEITSSSEDENPLKQVSDTRNTDKKLPVWDRLGTIATSSSHSSRKEEHSSRERKKSRHSEEKEKSER